MAPASIGCACAVCRAGMGQTHHGEAMSIRRGVAPDRHAKRASPDTFALGVCLWRRNAEEFGMSDPEASINCVVCVRSTASAFHSQLSCAGARSAAAAGERALFLRKNQKDLQLESRRR
eukprot:5328261-Prymnesium_polylepis.2